MSANLQNQQISYQQNQSSINSSLLDYNPNPQLIHNQNQLIKNSIQSTQSFGSTSSNYEKYMQILAQSSHNTSQNRSTELSFAANTQVKQQFQQLGPIQNSISLTGIAQQQNDFFPQNKSQIDQNNNFTGQHQQTPSLTSLCSQREDLNCLINLGHLGPHKNEHNSSLMNGSINLQENPSLQGDFKVLQIQMSQVLYKIEKLEQESVHSQDRVNSLTKICQLQQKFQENWEDEQETMKKYVDNKIQNKDSLLSQLENADCNSSKSGNTSLKEFNRKLESLQKQIDSLGEDIALDINKLEKSVKSIEKQSSQSHNSILEKANHSTVLSSLSTLQDDSGNINNKKLIGFIQEQLQKFDDAKVNIEDFKNSEAKILKLIRETQLNRKGQNKLSQIIKTLQDKILNQQKLERNQSVNSISRSASKSRHVSPSNVQKNYYLSHQVKQQSSKLQILTDDIQRLKTQMSFFQNTLITNSLIDDQSIINDLSRQPSHKLLNDENLSRRLYTNDDMETFDQTSQFNDNSNIKRTKEFSNQNYSQTKDHHKGVRVQKSDKKVCEFRKVRGRANQCNKSQQKVKSQSRGRSLSKSAQRINQRDITPLKQNKNLHNKSLISKQNLLQSSQQQNQLQGETQLKKSLHAFERKHSQKRNIRERSASFDLTEMKSRQNQQLAKEILCNTDSIWNQNQPQKQMIQNQENAYQYVGEKPNQKSKSAMSEKKQYKRKQINQQNVNNSTFIIHNDAKFNRR